MICFFPSSTAFPTIFRCQAANLMLRDAHPPEAEELAGIDKVPDNPSWISSIPSGELTYPTLGKGKPSTKLAFQGIC